MADQKRMSYTTSCGAYGARIFLETPVPEKLFPVMAALSCWGGHDKSGVNFKAWEFSPGHIGPALQRAAENGYSMNNHDWELW